jgi:hypothetical protein
MEHEYRVWVSVRARGKAPMDESEFKSEHYDDLEDFITQIKEFLQVNIEENEGNDEEDETED